MTGGKGVPMLDLEEGVGSAGPPHLGPAGRFQAQHRLDASGRSGAAGGKGPEPLTHHPSCTSSLEGVWVSLPPAKL